MDFLMGVDVGGTNIVCGILDLDGNLIDKIKEPTEASNGEEYVIRKIALMIGEILARNDISAEKVLSVGIGIPGIVDPLKGISISATNLRWYQVPVAQHLADLLNIPVFMDNDVRMYIFGESLKGSGQGYEHVLGVTIGTGLAIAFVDRGRLLYGGGFMAGELGHVPMDDIPHPCKCGLIGCMEIYVSAPGMVLQAKSKIAEGHESILQVWNPDLKTMRSKDISHAYDLDDYVAKYVFKQTARLLAKGLSNAIAILSPDVIVIGGGMALAGERLLAPTRESLQKLIDPLYDQRIEIKTAVWNDEAGVIGSALYAKQRVQQS